MAHVFSERKIAPARSKLAKNATFAHAGAKNISRHPTTPHAGAVFLSSQSDPYPTGETKLALLASISAQAVQNSPSTRKTPQNQRFFASRANFFAVWPRSTPAGRVFSRRWVPQPPQHARRLPRLKPMTPMRVDHCHEMKPLTPVLPQNSQFQAIFRPRRRRRFHPPLTEHPHRRRWFHQASDQGLLVDSKTLMLATSITLLWRGLGVCGVFFGCSGATGFNACCSWASSGDGGFKVATLPRPVREKVRPAWPNVGASAKKFAQHRQNCSKSGSFG